MRRIAIGAADGENVLVFLDMIAFSEGISTVKGSDEGYNVLYGVGRFHGIRIACGGA